MNWDAVGPPGQQQTKSFSTLAFMTFVDTALWTGVTLASVWVIKQVHLRYKLRGLDGVAELKREATKSVARGTFQAARENQDVIREVAYENRQEIASTLI